MNQKEKPRAIISQDLYDRARDIVQENGYSKFKYGIGAVIENWARMGEICQKYGLNIHSLESLLEHCNDLKIIYQHINAK